jgi:type IV secretory pathway VirB10-like protein
MPVLSNQKETTMSRNLAASGSKLSPVVSALMVCLALAACSKQPSSSTPAAAAGPEATADSDASYSDLKARQEELARREAAVAEKERELQLAQREAKVADQEQQLAREKQEAEAAAAKAAAARDSALKVAAAKKAAASKAASSKMAASSGSSKPPEPVFQNVEVAAGTPLTLALASDLSSKTARPGDSFEATVASNLTVGGRVVVPTGTRITGNVTEVISGSHAIGATPTLGLKFNQLELEDGQIIPITGELMEQGASEKVSDTAKILGGAAVGAVLGHQVKTNNRGKVIGGLLGGAVGAIAAKNTGSEVELASGSTLTLTTGEPFMVKVRS